MDKKIDNTGFRKFFESTGLTKKEFAKKAGISYDIVYCYTKDTRGLTSPMAEKIAKVFDVEPSSITGAGNRFKFIVEAEMMIYPKADGSFDMIPTNSQRKSYTVPTSILTKESEQAITDVISGK